MHNEKYRSSGEHYLKYVREANAPGETDVKKAYIATRSFHEQMLHGISAIANIIENLDGEISDPELITGLGSVINELSVFAFDSYEEMIKLQSSLAPKQTAA